MKRILILGAGRSTSALIDYLAPLCPQHDWQLTVGDLDLSLAAAKLKGRPNCRAIQFNIHNETQRESEITRSDLVISMLPARFHGLVALPCVRYGKHLLTASYLPDDIKALHGEAIAKGILILMETGLDPGIDHMSAMRVLDQIKATGGELQGFETFAGGLLAPESCVGNPWEYKFTWNPRNVVLAGQGTVKFIQEGRFKFIPYHRVFRRTEVVEIPGYGYFEGYANRDSLKYLHVYRLEGIQTLYRGTFRRLGFCKTWDIFVQLGATEDTYQMEGVANMTHRQFINSFLSYDPHNSVELKLAHYLNLDLDGEEMFRLKWLDLFEEIPIGLQKGSPAEILKHILQKKWGMQPDDRDMIVMWHKFDFMQDGKARQIQSHMVLKGENSEDTAMARTVGLPLGIAAKLVLTNKIQTTGVHIPVIPELYLPILEELGQKGIEFVEREIEG